MTTAMCLHTDAFACNLTYKTTKDPNDRCFMVHADCGVVLPTLSSNSVNVVIADPPYGGQTQNNNDWDIPWTQEKWNEVVADVFRVLLPGGHFVVFASGKTTFTIFNRIMFAYKSDFNTEPSFYHQIWYHGANDSTTSHNHIPRSHFEDILVLFRTGEGNVMEENGCLTLTPRMYHHTGRGNAIHAYKANCRAKPEKTVQDYFKDKDRGVCSTFDLKPKRTS